MIPFPLFFYFKASTGAWKGGFLCLILRQGILLKGTIKTIDKSAVAAERMKSAFIQTKEKAEHSVDVPESSAEEYASNRLESGIDRVSHEAIHQFDKQGRKGVQATKQNIVKAKDGIQKFKEKRAAQSLQKQAQDGSSTKKKSVKAAAGGTAEEGSKRVCPFRREKDD